MFKKLLSACIIFTLSYVSARATVYTVTNAADAGAGSLRAAITSVNGDATPGPHWIRFSASGPVALASDYPAFTRSVIIDGRTAPGYVAGTPSFIINGNGRLFFSANAAINISIWGLRLNGGNQYLMNFQNTLGDTVAYCTLEDPNAASIVINNAAVTSGYVFQNNIMTSVANGEFAMFTNASNVNISNNTLYNATFRDLIVINSTVSNYIISNNSVAQCGNFVNGATSNITNLTSSNNTVTIFQNNGYNFGTLTNFTMSSNSLTRSGTGGNAGFYILTSNTGTVTNNTIAQFNYGIHFALVANSVNCSSNIINRGAVGGNYGIRLVAGTSNIINSNRVRFYQEVGIYLSGTGHTFNGNRVTEGAGSSTGIALNAAINCSGISDTITNGGIGIHMTANSRYNTFGGTGAGRCYITLFSIVGARIENSNANNILNNQIASGTGTAPGVHITGTSRINSVKSCLIGVSPTGLVAAGNGGHGVFIEGANANNNMIGGYAAADGNIIAANGQCGVMLDNGGPDSTKILYNNIGVGSDGSTSMVNGTGTNHHGIRFNNNTSMRSVMKYNVITTPGRGYGISMEGGSEDSISYNFIGVNRGGTAMIGVGNGQDEDGIFIKGTAPTEVITFNIIGGAKGDGISLDGGTFANCTIQGNYIGTDVTGNVKFGVGTNNNNCAIKSNSVSFTNLLLLDNIASGSTGYGVFLDGGTSTNVSVRGNIIGMDKNGTATTFGNVRAGFYMQAGSCTGLTIGGTNLADRNLISMNGRFVHSCGAPSEGGGIVLVNCNSVTIQGNYIGVDATGNVIAGNGNSGITFNGGCNSSLVGGLVAGARNVIGGNGFFCTGVGDTRHGVQFVNNGSATLHEVYGNYVGIGADGTTLVGNEGEGVSSFETRNIRVGGATAAHRNIISGNMLGIFFQQGAATGCRAQGNYVGTDVTGTLARPNNVGIQVGLASGTLIGGPNAGEGNLISGNTSHGILLGNADNTTIQQNMIGTQVNGTSALGNGGNGIQVQQQSGTTTGVLIGSPTNTSLGNIIAFNLNGINIPDASQAHIRRNSIFCNTNKGINLNGLGNANIDIDPLISVAPYISAPTPGITGTFTNQAPLNGTDVIEVFYDNACGGCQGRTYLGDATSLNSPAAGDWSYSPLPAAADCTPKGAAGCLSGVNNITATRSDAGGNTSEFMVCDPIALPVQLISFEAKKYSESDVLISWTTISETDNAYFELVRSTDGHTFSSVVKIPGAGNSSTINEYSHIDENLPAGVWYYMLIQVDEDGKQHNSEIIVINTSDKNHVEVVPTIVHAGDPVRILNFTGSDLVSVALVDMSGKVLMERTGVSGIESTITTAGLSTGMYTIRIKSATNVETEKIFVH